MFRSLLYSRLAIILGLFTLLAPLFGDDRVGLVIGNNDYPDDSAFPDLRNCINDARLISRTLQSVGFEVIEVMDADLSTMEDALITFESRIKNGGTAVAYFAGHGIEYEGKNYLMATNARFKARSFLTREAIKAEVFAAAMVQAGARSSFLLLDCCRELPRSAEWAGRGQKKFGLAEISIDGDIMISMAASPGKQALEPGTAGGNSPYALALSKWIPSGKNHLELFQNVRKEVHEMTNGLQRTWENGSFIESFYFADEEKPNATQDNRIAAMQAEIDRLKEEVGKGEMKPPPNENPPGKEEGTIKKLPGATGSIPIQRGNGFFPPFEERAMTERETPVKIIPGLNLKHAR